MDDNVSLTSVAVSESSGEESLSQISNQFCTVLKLPSLNGSVNTSVNGSVNGTSLNGTLTGSLHSLPNSGGSMDGASAKEAVSPPTDGLPRGRRSSASSISNSSKNSRRNRAPSPAFESIAGGGLAALNLPPILARQSRNDSFT